MSGPVAGEGRDPGGCVLTGRADCEDLEAQRGRVRRLRETEAADYEIRAAVKGLESVLRSVIIEQGALVRRLRTDGPHQAQYEEAVARLQSLKQEFQEVSGRLWLDVRDEGPSYAEIRDQRARVTKLREDKVAESEIREAVNKLRSLLSEAILAQSALVLELKWGRAWKSVITEAENRLKTLKAEFLADTGSEWSDVREEGPVLLTTNQVRGSEVLPELRVKIKQLKRENVLR